jgi:aldehyde:ferredoxin oxidoreductase
VPFGWAGTNLEIDLSLGKIEKKESDSELHETYLGGRGINTQMFWDRVPVEVAAFSPDNLLIFGAGVLTGTFAPGANRTVLTTRSPQTNLQTYSNLGGFWGAELKHAGYDTVAISGKSPPPVYLWIKDDNVEIRDASHLWGRDVRETQRVIREELHKEKVQILCIGPSGENKVYAASIEHSSGVSASRAGVGAIMGDKNLKAIAVCGTNDINIAKPSEFIKSCEQILKKTDRIRAFFDNWSYESAQGMMDHMAYGNLGEQIPYENSGKLHADFVEKSRSRITPCHNCGIGCKNAISLPDGGHSFVKCQSWFTFMVACKIRDFTFNMKCYNLCEKYGLDTISTANYIAFVIDLYEKGILTKKDTEGIHLEWGNEDVAFLLIEKIALREGIGALLANGVYEAARMIGKGAEEHVHHVKKMELVPFGLYTPYRALRTSITDKADMTRAEAGVPQHGLAAPRDWKEQYIKSGFFSYSKELEKLFLDDFVGLARDYEKIVPFTSHDADKNALADCTGLCIFWTGFWRYNPINLGDHINLISHATGMDIDEIEAMKIARRAGTLLRAYNVMTGIRRKDDRPPEKYFRDPPPQPYFRLDRDKFNKMIDEYYKLRGWNSEGIPSKDELDRLGLNHVRQTLEEKGLL